MRRGNIALYIFEAISVIAAGLTYTSTENQQYLQILFAIVLLSSMVQLFIAMAIACPKTKILMIVFNAISVIISTIMLVMNSKTAEDAKEGKVAVKWPWKFALVISAVLPVIANYAIIPWNKWSCGVTSEVGCRNPDNFAAIQKSIRKYFNAARGEKKPLTGRKASEVNLDDLKDDDLEQAQIAYITVDDDGNEQFDCKGFKTKVDRLTSELLTSKKRKQIEDKKALRDKDLDPSKPAANPRIGGLNLPDADRAALERVRAEQRERRRLAEGKFKVD